MYHLYSYNMSIMLRMYLCWVVEVCVLTDKQRRWFGRRAGEVKSLCGRKDSSQGWFTCRKTWRQSPASTRQAESSQRLPSSAEISPGSNNCVIIVQCVVASCVCAEPDVQQHCICWQPFLHKLAWCTAL